LKLQKQSLEEEVVTEVVAAVRMEVDSVENSKEIGMVDNAEKAEVSVVKEGLETKVADKDVKVDLETKVADNVVKEASKKKVVANDAKAVVNVVKEGQVHRIEVRLMENRSRENHNQFKESIS
jgi:hypothetical protein